MPKISKNLFLDAEVVARGERYGARHNTTLSKLVSDFLASLPDGAESHELTPEVRRLLGIAARPTDENDAGDAAYHEHLWAKYGSP